MDSIIGIYILSNYHKQKIMSYQYFKLTLKGEEPHYPIMPCDRFEYIFRTTTTDKSAAEAEIHSTAKMLVEEVVSITPVKPKKSL